ncbi:MAG TPA: hypothetical protein VI485_00650 [Vicinamibacterales bacterium]|nr:hypothetical protein [Vicinamibacterales bacterium]
MSHSMRRALPLFAALVLVCGCSDKNDDGGGGSGNPGGGPSTTPPPSGVVALAGNWTGTSDFQQNGIRYISNLTATITQTDRSVAGNVTFTGPSLSGWTATLTGQLSGDSPLSQFFGNITMLGPATSGGGTCSGQVSLSGQTRTNTLRWEAPTMRITPTGNSTSSTVCLGDVFTIVWILGR